MTDNIKPFRPGMKPATDIERDILRHVQQKMDPLLDVRRQSDRMSPHSGAPARPLRRLIFRCH